MYTDVLRSVYVRIRSLPKSTQFSESTARGRARLSSSRAIAGARRPSREPDGHHVLASRMPASVKSKSSMTLTFLPIIHFSQFMLSHKNNILCIIMALIIPAGEVFIVISLRNYHTSYSCSKTDPGISAIKIEKNKKWKLFGGENRIW